MPYKTVWSRPTFHLEKPFRSVTREPIGRVVMVAVLATVLPPAGSIVDLSCRSSAYSTSVSQRESATIWRYHRPQKVLWISSFASSHFETTVSYEDCATPTHSVLRGKTELREQRAPRFRLISLLRCLLWVPSRACQCLDLSH